jgi:SNF2 family DNA or RNA helicase
MGELREHTEDLFKNWVLSNGVVSIQLTNKQCSVSATDIVRVEFKGYQKVTGVTVDAKPSEHLPALRFNRFPCELRIKLLMPTNLSQRPAVELSASYGGRSFPIERVPQLDQIIIGNNSWYPLIPENIGEISSILKEIKVDGSGPVTLRQALDLTKVDSSLVSVENISELTNDCSISDCGCDQALELLACNGFQADLYPYQKNGFFWLKSISEEGLGCVLADEMGLGKTLQVIAVLSYFKLVWNQPSLIIAPATLLENWRREFARFSREMTVYVHSGNERTGFPSHLTSNDIVVCSYDTAVRDQGLFGMIEWGFVVLDEAQAIKNAETRRAVAAKGLKRRAAIAVTGTPVENKLADLWSIMDFSCPGLLASRKAFDQTYGDDYESAEKLETVVSPLMLRRRVADVATDLPERIIIPQPVNMSDTEISHYDLIRQQIADEYGKSATLISLLRLRQFCTHPILLEEDGNSIHISPMQSSKFCRLLEIVEEIALNREKVIIFTSFTDMSDLLNSELAMRFSIPSWQIDGRTPVVKRQEVVDTFSAVAGSAALILNPRAAGTGLNITAANHVIHYTLEWNPAVEDQATARAFRRGQILPVTVHRLFYPDTVEEVINDRLDRKRQLAEVAVVGTEAPEVETADIARALQLSPINTPNGKKQ